jgi:hypothetical protein
VADDDFFHFGSEPLERGHELPNAGVFGHPDLLSTGSSADGSDVTVAVIIEPPLEAVNNTVRLLTSTAPARNAGRE